MKIIISNCIFEVWLETAPEKNNQTPLFTQQKKQLNISPTLSSDCEVDVCMELNAIFATQNMYFPSVWEMQIIQIA